MFYLGTLAWKLQLAKTCWKHRDSSSYGSGRGSWSSTPLTLKEAGVRCALNPHKISWGFRFFSLFSTTTWARQALAWTERERQRETERERDRQRERQKETETERENNLKTRNEPHIGVRYLFAVYSWLRKLNETNKMTEYHVYEAYWVLFIY